MQEETRYCLQNPDKVSDTLQLMIGDQNVTWEKLLSPAPLGVAVLGQLMIVAANQQDFPIDHHKERFNLIKHPESFRTTLLNISNQGYTAFGKAHSNMEQIRLLMQQVPTHVREVVKILESGNAKAVEKFLPLRLKRIQEAAQHSLKRSSEVKDVFTELGELISQVIEATSLSKSLNEKEAQEQEKSKKVEEERQKKLQEELERKTANAQHLKHRELKESDNRQRAYEAANERVGLAERVASWFGHKNVDARRRAEAKDLIAEANAQMERVKAEAQQTEQEMKKINDDILKSLLNMQKTDVSRMSAEEAVQLLKNGLKNLGELKGHWAQLTSYFQRINNIIEQATSKKLEDFREEAEEASKDRTLLQFIADSTLQSSQHSYLTYRIADMYVNVSGKYIMDSVARLGKMITASDNIEEAQNELAQSCREASEGITQMVVNSKETLIREIDQRINELELETCLMTQE